jgi:glycosyltransferase involved in cell wall biosynthesis
MCHVAVLLEYPTLCGGEQSLLSVAQPLIKSGFTFTAVAPPGGPLAAALARLAIRHVPFHFRDQRNLRHPLEVLRQQLTSCLKKLAPDILHANSLSVARVAGPVVEALDLPSIGHLRDILNLSQSAIADLNRHTRLLAVSQATLDFHLAAGLEPSKSKVLYSGVDTSLFSPRPATHYLHDELELDRHSLLLGSVGQIALRKGLDVLLDAFCQIASRIPTAHLLVVGQRLSTKRESIDHEAGLQQSAHEAGLDNRVHLLGHRNDLPDLLPELSLLIHTARQEPLGRILLEGAACGLPIVATDVGGTREIFPSDETAILVSADDAEATSAAATEVLKNSQLAASLAAAARERIINTFPLERAAANMAREYRELRSL